MALTRKRENHLEKATERKPVAPTGMSSNSFREPLWRFLCTKPMNPISSSTGCTGTILALDFVFNDLSRPPDKLSSHMTKQAISSMTLISATSSWHISFSRNPENKPISGIQSHDAKGPEHADCVSVLCYRQILFLLNDYRHLTHNRMAKCDTDLCHIQQELIYYCLISISWSG